MGSPVKKWYASKTLWFNLGSVLILWIVPLVLPEFVLSVPPEWEIFKVPVVTVVNVILRFITKEPVEL